MNQEKIGKFILENRKKKNLTQNELAKKLKVSNHTISNWENGKSMPSYELLIPLTKELDISITELINGDFESNKEEPNKTIEKTINFLKQIDNNQKKKNRNIGILIIVIGFIIKILTMIFTMPYWWSIDYYGILAYIISLIGIANIYKSENIKKLILKTIVGGIICLAIFTVFDISTIKHKNIKLKYVYQTYYYGKLDYFKTPFYDVYTCVEDRYGEYKISGYNVVPKNYFLTVAELEKKYCKNK